MTTGEAHVGIDGWMKLGDRLTRKPSHAATGTAVNIVV